MMKQHQPIRMLAAAAAAFLCLGGAACKRADHEQNAPGSGPAGQAGQALDDSGITAKVKAELAADKEVSGLQITVDTEHGKVTLSGSVPAAQIARAEQIARGVQGVREVDNQLKAAAGPSS